MLVADEQPRSVSLIVKDVLQQVMEIAELIVLSSGLRIVYGLILTKGYLQCASDHNVAWLELYAVSVCSLFVLNNVFDTDPQAIGKLRHRCLIFNFGGSACLAFREQCNV